MHCSRVYCKISYSTTLLKQCPILSNKCIFFSGALLYPAHGLPLAENKCPKTTGRIGFIPPVLSSSSLLLLLPHSFKLPMTSSSANQWSFLCLHASWPLLNLCLALTHSMFSQKAVLSAQCWEQFYPRFPGKRLQSSAWNVNHWDTYTCKPMFFFFFKCKCIQGG